MHRYFYGNDNPLRYIDPTGHQVVTANPEGTPDDAVRTDISRLKADLEARERALFERDSSKGNDAHVVTEKRSQASGITGWLSKKWNEYEEGAERLKKKLGSAASGAWHSLFGGESSPEADARRSHRDAQTAAFDDDANSKRVLHEAELTGKGVENETAEVAREGTEQGFEAGKTYAETELGGKAIGAAAGALKVGGKAVGRELGALKAEERALAAEERAAAAAERGPGRYVARAETKGAEAAAYEEAVAGGRPGQAYQVPYNNPNPRGRPHVYFDGEVGGVPIDAKTSIVTRAKTIDQARRQAEALRQSQSIGVWKVPTEAEARRARQMIERAKAGDTILIVVEK